MRCAKKTPYIIFLILLLIYFFLIFVAFLNLSNYISTTSSYAKDIRIILDAGHGGEDGGATDNGIIEKDINLSITKYLADVFRMNGFEVETIRDIDTMINTDGDTIRQRKISDMKNRLEIYNKSNRNIIISIHQNKFTQEQYYGTQIFYSGNNSESFLLSESIKESVITLLQPENKRECKVADNGIYLLYNTNNPAVIVECGFISNNEEATRLKTEEYQKQLAYSIFIGFINYYNRG